MSTSILAGSESGIVPSLSTVNLLAQPSNFVTQSPQSPGRANGVTPRSARSALSKGHASNAGILTEYPSSDHFLRQEDGEETVAHMITILIDVSYEVILDRELQARLIPFVVRQAKRDLLTVVKSIDLTRDAGDLFAHEQESWAPDVEIPQVLLDSHSRGVIPVTVRPRSAPLDQVDAMQGNFPPRAKKSISSLSLTKSREQTADMKLDSRTPQNLNDTGISGISDILSKPLIEQSSQDTTTEVSSAKHRHVERIKDKIEQDRKAAEQLKQKLQQIEKEESDKFNRLRHELKGKEYTYDVDGSVIFISHINPDKLPTNKLPNPVYVVMFRMKVRVNVASDESSGQSHSLSKSLKRDSPPKKGKGKNEEGSDNHTATGGNPNPVKKKAVAEEVFFKEAQIVPISNVDNIKLASGVIVREGSKMRSGQKKTGDPNRWSKKDYELALQTNSFARTAIPPASGMSAPSNGKSREDLGPVGIPEPKLASRQKEIVNQTRQASRELSSRELEESQRLEKIANMSASKV